MFRQSAVLLASMVIALASVVAAGEKTEPRTKIKKLLEKRTEVRTQILRLVTAGYRQGNNSFDQVVEAESSLLKAKLDLCETNDQRVQIHDEMVKVAETSLEVTKKLFQAGQATQTDFLKGEAHLLEVQIGLENAKAAK